MHHKGCLGRHEQLVACFKKRMGIELTALVRVDDGHHLMRTHIVKKQTFLHGAYPHPAVVRERDSSDSQAVQHTSALGVARRMDGAEVVARVLYAAAVIAHPQHSLPSMTILNTDGPASMDLNVSLLLRMS